MGTRIPDTNCNCNLVGHFRSWPVCLCVCICEGKGCERQRRNTMSVNVYICECSRPRQERYGSLRTGKPFKPLCLCAHSILVGRSQGQSEVFSLLIQRHHLPLKQLLPCIWGANFQRGVSWFCITKGGSECANSTRDLHLQYRAINCIIVCNYFFIWKNRFEWLLFDWEHCGFILSTTVKNADTGRKKKKTSKL